MVGYICSECCAHIKSKEWPKEASSKLYLSYGVLALFSAPVLKFLWKISDEASFVAGILIFAIFIVIPFWAKPKGLPWFSYELQEAKIGDK
ncbi:hypothetical protein [Teredinibacter sp. KSP-S5-2]|uniref:hypothetical protein n=1 Tax=Teredinibacter sp. KSP-S5-2 TaxID=3034506 RepID=UPI002934944F|nr:hypothetical protein [Teredinibacter sp. KSP-S5-2]WNO11648.1 hypothetical protein P5V12_10740 [Teredinibacter sp. KSP-S5-2]